jgi:hypothetical protein
MSLSYKYLIPFVLFFVSAFNSFSQCQDLGEGVVSVQQFAFPPGVTPPLFIGDSLPKNLLYHFFYCIKKDNIYRNDLLDSSTWSTDFKANSHSVDQLKVEIAHPIYVIDYKKRVDYIYSLKKDFILKIGLEENTLEMFYRSCEGRPQNTVDSLTEGQAVFIAGRKCFKGKGTAGDEKFIFFYTKEPLPVLSPLNNFLPASFRYNVMAARFNINWTLEDGKPGTGTTIFQLSDISKANLPDSLFEIPTNIPIKENIPLQKLFF